jgi:hypothetical protein
MQQRTTAQARTVQDYIDETPLWADGTAARAAPMTFMHWRIWWLAVAGKFFEGLVDYLGRKTMFVFEIMGTTLLLSVLVGTSLLDALVTWMFRIKTTGIDLETVGAEPLPNQRSRAGRMKLATGEPTIRPLRVR